MSEDLNRIANGIEASWYANPRPSPLYRGPDGATRIVLDAPAELLTMNRAKSTHYRAWAKLTAAWRGAMAERARFLAIPPVEGRVSIDGYPYQLSHIADAGAHMPCLKACVDGLRDAGVLVDDSPEHVAWVRCWAPVKARGAGMVVELRPVVEELGREPAPGGESR